MEYVKSTECSPLERASGVMLQSRSANSSCSASDFNWSSYVPSLGGLGGRFAFCNLGPVFNKRRSGLDRSNPYEFRIRTVVNCIGCFRSSGVTCVDVRGPWVPAGDGAGPHGRIRSPLIALLS